MTSLGKSRQARPAGRFHLRLDIGSRGEQVDRASSAKTCNALLIYPRFEADTFWSFKRTSEVFGAKYPASPLGLITVAALLPQAWSIRLLDRNTEELTDDDLDWADLILTGGMLPQGGDTLDIVDLCRQRGKPVVIGGPGSRRHRIFIGRRTSKFSAKPKGSSTNLSKPGKQARVKGSLRQRNSRSM